MIGVAVSSDEILEVLWVVVGSEMDDVDRKQTADCGCPTADALAGVHFRRGGNYSFLCRQDGVWSLCWSGKKDFKMLGGSVGEL